MTRPITEWVPTGEAARILGYGRATVAARITDGKLTALTTKLGVLIDPDSLEELRLKEATDDNPRH